MGGGTAGGTAGGGTGGGMMDGGTTDGGMMDGGTTDGGMMDGGMMDGGTLDGGTTDGGMTDGGTTDGGTLDGGTTDGGADAGLQGESCASPIDLFPGLTAITDGGLVTTTFTVNTALFADDHTGTCNATGGPEAVYRVQLPAAQSLTVTAQRQSGMNMTDPVLYVRSAGCVSGSQITCSDAVAAASAENAFFSTLPAGDYFIFIEHFGVPGVNAGPIDVTVTVGSVLTVNDDCASALELEFDGGVATVFGDTRFARNDNDAGDPAPVCSASSRATGLDLVYSYTVPSNTDVTIRATPTTPPSPSTWQPSLYVRRPGVCASGAQADQVTCSAVNGSTSLNLELERQDGGTYSLWVDGNNNTAGPFQLTVTARPAPTPGPGDTCSAAIPIALAMDAGVALLVDTREFNRDYAPAAGCGPSPAGGIQRDVVYAVTTTVAGDLQVNARRQPLPDGGALSQPTVFARSSPCDTGTQLNCAGFGNAQGTTMLARNVPAGTTYVFVKGFPGAHGPTDVTFNQLPASMAPANDACASVQAVPLDGGSAVVTGFTINAASDSTPNCAYTTGSPDVVYTTTLTAPADLVATVTPDPASPDFHPAVSIRPVCLTTDLSCARAPAPGLAASTAVLNAQPGTYFIWVDSANGPTSGRFTLTLSANPPTPAPSNDLCLNPLLLFADGGRAGYNERRHLPVPESRTCERSPSLPPSSWPPRPRPPTSTRSRTTRPRPRSSGPTASSG